jgi:hypothetical protein
MEDTMRHVPTAVALVLVWSCSGAPSTESGKKNPGAGPNGDDPTGEDTGDGGASGPGRLDGSIGITQDGATAVDPDSGLPTVPVNGPLLERLTSSTVTVSAGVKAGVNNWRIWGEGSLGVAPVFTVPLANCGTLVGFTAGTAKAPHAYVAVLDASDALVRTIDLGAYECRGIAAEPDGHFAALLWAPGPSSDCADPTKNGRIYVTRFDRAGAAGWSTELTNKGNAPNCPTDWGIGESRLEFGNGTYGAYYHVHSKSGHEGDTLKYLDLTGAETTKWDWGCSHSMSNVLRFNATESKFLPACVSDCYPGTKGSDFKTTSIGGLYTNNKNKVIDMNAGCNGSVAGELGSAAPAATGWKTVFNGHQNPATLGQSSYDKKTMNQDIGFAAIASNLTSGPVVWLTTTSSINEADSSIERWQPSGETVEQYVVGWAEPGTPYAYKLARVSPTGAFLEGPVDVSSKVRWGRRDDPFRVHRNGDVVWSWFAAAGDTTMHIARIRSGGTAQCAAF